MALGGAWSYRASLQRVTLSANYLYLCRCYYNGYEKETFRTWHPINIALKVPTFA